MMENKSAYHDFLVKKTLEQIGKNLSDESVICDTLKYHINGLKVGEELKGSLKFQKYYLEIMCADFKIEPNFIKEFKSNYSIQGIDRKYLQSLQDSILQIKKYSSDGNLVPMYEHFFWHKKISHGKNEFGEIVEREKTHGSFFTKLLHTFNPENFCALDNLVKDELGLKNESYFVSLLVVSEAYNIWCNANPDFVRKIKDTYVYGLKDFKLDFSAVTNMKLMDLLFWAIADKKIRSEKQVKKP